MLPFGGNNRERRDETGFGIRYGRTGKASGQKENHALAMELYATGNYDAQTLAGIVAEPDKMTATDFERWMETANCRATADYVVAVTLAETGFAEELADRWIESEDEDDQSAGWNC